MPFANCQSCGRLFHLFDPVVPEPHDGYWPNLQRGNAQELCPECSQRAAERDDRDHRTNKSSGP